MQNIIVDTDLGFDCDDAGALLLANYYHNQKDINLLAVTHCVNRIKGAVAIEKINDYYGNGDIQIGVSNDYAFNVDNLFEEFFLKLKYRDDFQGFNEKPSFYKLLNAVVLDEETKGKVYNNAVELLIDKLKNAEDKSVTLVCIGQLNNFANLIKTDKELVKRKLKKAVVMCGNFKQDGDYYDDGETLWHGEFNVIMDVKSAKAVVSNSDLEIDFVDYNNGDDIVTGDGLIGQEDNPVYKMYKIHGRGRECSSWDLVALMCATGLYNGLFERSNSGTVEIINNGKTVFNVGGGKHRLITVKDKLLVREEINKIFQESKR